MFLLFSPSLLKGFKVLQPPLSQEAATRAIGRAAPTFPSSPLPRRSLRETGSLRAGPAARPRPPRRRAPARRFASFPSCSPRGSGSARSLRSPAEATPGVPGPHYSYLVPELTGHPALHAELGAGAVRSGAAAPVRPRPGAVGGAPVALLARRRLQHPRPSPALAAAPIPGCVSGTSHRAAITSLRPQALLV